MNKHYALITLLLLTTLHNTCMEIKTFIKNPTNVACINSTTVAIGGKEGFGLYNTKTKQCIKEENTPDIQRIITHKNQSVFGIITPRAITVYDSATHEITWQLPTDTFTPCEFNPRSDKEIIISDHKKGCLKFYSIKGKPQTNEQISILTDRSNLLSVPISCHLTQKKMINYVRNNSFEIVTIREKIDTRLVNPIEKKAETKTVKLDENLVIMQIGYMLAGNDIAIVTKKSCFLYQQYYSPYFHSHHTQAEMVLPVYHETAALASHPNNRFIAILGSDNVINYWDRATIRIIATSKLNEETPITHTSTTQRLVFLPNGVYILVALQEKCLIVPIPLSVLYSNTSLTTLFFLFKTLKLYDTFLSIEIIQHIFEPLCIFFKYNFQQLPCKQGTF